MLWTESSRKPKKKQNKKWLIPISNPFNPRRSPAGVLSGIRHAHRSSQLLRNAGEEEEEETPESASTPFPGLVFPLPTDSWMTAKEGRGVERCHTR